MVSTFPFHDFVAMSDNAGSVAVLAKGIRSYDADGAGTLRLHLRRAVEWLTAADLPHRIGDAGPFFYVPDARCERTVRRKESVWPSCRTWRIPWPCKPSMPPSKRHL